MAAYASIVSLSQTMQQFLHHEYDHPQLPTALVGDLQIESLQEHVKLLQAFLDDSRDDKVTMDLEGRIRDASNVAEHTLQYFILDHFQAARSQDFPFLCCLKDLWKELKLTYISRRLAHQLQNMVTQEIGSIVAEVMDIKNMATTRRVGEVTDIKNNTSSVDFGDSPSSRLPPTIGKDEIMVGFDDDLLAIKSCLCGNSSRREIIPICGMGGIGKTTLARNAYQDPLTVHRFHVRAWVTVSQDYKAQEVLSRLRISIKESVEDQNDPDDEAVYKSLKGMRYLIVLDDMWSTEVWDDVKRLFPDDNNGSRVLLTTRLVDVAAYAEFSSNLHQMCLMGEDQSWQLLQQKVFKESHCPPQLEDIGMAIARRCKGLPLAIVVVAGISSTISRTEAPWKEVANKVSSTFSGNDDEITKIFSLSYTNLPHHLRPCFLYIGRFPEDYEIHASKLVKLWTAEGFMKPRGSKCFEDVAEEYLEDLVKRSLVLVMTRKSNGRIKSCSMHDVLRDLCIRKAKEEKFFLGLRPKDHFGFLRFRLLRVLDATKTKLKKFPDVVLELYLLRYLALSFFFGKLARPDIVQLDVPPSISKLQNLQTLLICPSRRIYSGVIRVRFPSGIWSMRRLRHLHVVGFIAVVPMPEPYPSPFSLQDLQTLVTVKNFRCTERVLQMIQNLKKLGIRYDFEAGSGGRSTNLVEEYHLHNLVHMCHLEKLSIRVVGEFPALATNLRFPTMLKKLKLEYLRLSKQVMGIIGLLPNLEVLKLHSCNFEDPTWETTEGEFPKLKFLQLSNTFLKEWITERSHFPRLNHLHLSSCHGIREIPEEIGEIPTLELIEVNKFGNKSLLESAERIKEKQQSYGNDFFQLRFT